MMGKTNLLGTKIGRLTIVEESGEKSKRGRRLFKCRCDCGNVCFAEEDKLVRKDRRDKGGGGIKRSCGCLKKEINTIKKKETTDVCVINSKLYRNNKSGVKGVYWNISSSRWVAQLTFQNKKIYLGNFLNKRDAIKAREEAEKEYFHPILEKYGKEQPK